MLLVIKYLIYNADLRDMKLMWSQVDLYNIKRKQRIGTTLDAGVTKHISQHKNVGMKNVSCLSLFRET